MASVPGDSVEIEIEYSLEENQMKSPFRVQEVIGEPRGCKKGP